MEVIERYKRVMVKRRVRGRRIMVVLIYCEEESFWGWCVMIWMEMRVGNVGMGRRNDGI